MGYALNLLNESLFWIRLYCKRGRGFMNLMQINIKLINITWKLRLFKLIPCFSRSSILPIFLLILEALTINIWCLFIAFYFSHHMIKFQLRKRLIAGYHSFIRGTELKYIWWVVFMAWEEYRQNRCPNKHQSENAIL